METVSKALASFILVLVVNALPPSAAKPFLFWGLMLGLGLWSCFQTRALAWRKGLGAWTLGGALAGCMLGVIPAMALGSGKASPYEVVLLAPLAEEMYYRGYLSSRLEAGLGPRWAFGLTTVLFAISHGGALGFAIALVVGGTCMFLSRKASSLWPPIALHVAYNLLQVLI